MSIFGVPISDVDKLEIKTTNIVKSFLKTAKELRDVNEILESLEDQRKGLKIELEDEISRLSDLRKHNSEIISKIEKMFLT